MRQQQMVAEFMRKFEMELPERFPSPAWPHALISDLWVRLIKEEAEELRQAVERLDMVEAADGICDLLYVTLGLAVALGVDVEPLFAEVHASNLSKLGEDGRPVRRADGKVLKGPSFRPPALLPILHRQGMRQDLGREVDGFTVALRDAERDGTILPADRQVAREAVPGDTTPLQEAAESAARLQAEAARAIGLCSCKRCGPGLCEPSCTFAGCDPACASKDQRMARAAAMLRTGQAIISGQHRMEMAVDGSEVSVVAVRPRCPVRSSVANAQCDLEEGHPAWRSDRHHKFSRPGMTEMGERLPPTAGDPPCSRYDPAGPGAGLEADGYPQCAACGHPWANHPKLHVCADCGDDQAAGIGQPCPRCGSHRTVVESLIMEHIGPNWRAHCWLSPEESRVVRSGRMQPVAQSCRCGCEELAAAREGNDDHPG